MATTMADDLQSHDEHLQEIVDDVRWLYEALYYVAARTGIDITPDDSDDDDA
jgi:hypothetical protein